MNYTDFSTQGSLVLISRDVLTIENAKGLLQGLDLFLAACNAVLVAFTCINTGWLELLVVGKGSIQFLLCAIEICLGLLEGLLMILLLTRPVFDVLGLLQLRELAHFQAIAHGVLHTLNESEEAGRVLAVVFLVLGIALLLALCRGESPGPDLNQQALDLLRHALLGLSVLGRQLQDLVDRLAVQPERRELR